MEGKAKNKFCFCLKAERKKARINRAVWYIRVASLYDLEIKNWNNGKFNRVKNFELEILLLHTKTDRSLQTSPSLKKQRDIAKGESQSYVINNWGIMCAIKHILNFLQPSFD